MSDSPQTESLTHVLLDFGAAVGWGMSYVLFLGGGCLISYQIRNLVSGVVLALDFSYLYLPTDVWGQTAMLLGVGLMLIATAAVLHPPCARRIIDRKLLQISDAFIWY